jgi:hypothetical protein
MISPYYHGPVEGSPLMRGSDEQPGYLVLSENWVVLFRCGRYAATR